MIHDEFNIDMDEEERQIIVRGLTLESYNVGKINWGGLK